MMDEAPRCDQHAGEPYPPRRFDCERVAADARREAAEALCLQHVWPRPCRECPPSSTASAQRLPLHTLSGPLRP